MVKEQYEDPDDEENSFVVVPSERKFPRAIERILGDVGFKKANIICENVNDKLATELGDAMCHNKSLETLNLYLNKISDVGAIAIARSITPLSALSELNLGGNKIGDKGLEALSGALASGALPALTSLGPFGLSGNPASEEAQQAVKDAIKNRT